LVDFPGKPFSAVQVRGTCAFLAESTCARFSVIALGVPELPTSLNDPRLVAPRAPRHLTWVKHPVNGAGLSTCCPSPTRFRLGLGPTHPLRNNRAAETLDIRRWGFSPHESLLIPTFALVIAPHRLTLMFHCHDDAPLPRSHKAASCASAADLSPGTLSAREPSTSELLRTLSRVAASKPTSWLSGRSHLLAH
jgi:hypothetical protein